MPSKVLVVGGGPGGYHAAQEAAEHGASVTIFERERLGGTCGTWGCIPTKTLFTAAHAMADRERLARSGLKAEYALDFGALKERMRKVVDATEKGVQFIMDRAKVTVVRGEAKVDAANKTVVCNGETYTGDALVLATGTTEGRPGCFNHPEVWTSRELLACETLPQSLVIIGAGAVGAEFACIFSAFGTKVTLVEMMDRVLPVEDADVSRELARSMAKRGITVKTGAPVERLTENGRGVVFKDCTTAEAERVVVAIGRKVLSDYPGLEMAGRFVKVDDRFETSVKGVYAVGDIVGGKMLAHEAAMEGRVAGMNAAGHVTKKWWREMPAATFTLPEVASVGLTEAQAGEKGEAHVGKFLFRALGKGLAEGQQEGFVKVVSNGNGVLVGGHIVGPNASDLIQELAMAVERGMTVREIHDSVHAHPTLPEAVQEACAECARSMGKPA